MSNAGTSAGPEAAASEPATVPEMFDRRRAADPDAPFMVALDGTSLTFRDLDTLAASLAAVLQAYGVTSGDVVGLYQWNDPSWFVAALATWRLGGLIACCGSVSPPAEAVRRFSLVSPKVVVSSEPAELADWPVITVDPSGRVVQAERLTSAAGDPTAATLPSPDTPAGIFFTSGTTGDAKPVFKLHGQFAEAPRQTAAAYSRSPSFRPRMADPAKPPALSFNPFGQAAAFGRLVFRLYIGRPIIMLRKFDVGVIAELAPRYSFDTLQLTPAMVHMLAFTQLEISLPALQYVTCGTAPLAQATRDAFEKRYGVPVLQAYGSTEGGVTALERYTDALAGRRGPGSVGRITADSNYRLVNAAGQDAAVGEEGEILGQPVNVVSQSGLGSLPLDADGWYHTGDLARIDEHGILYITGRLKDMMIVGGFNVYPGEVEDALRASPLVRDALVVGLADERLGEVPAAAVVWEPTAGRPTRAEAFAQLTMTARELLAAYKVPRRWLDLDQVPHTPNGKPDRLAVQRLAQASSATTAEVTNGNPARPQGGS